MPDVGNTMALCGVGVVWKVAGAAEAVTGASGNGRCLKAKTHRWR